MWSLNDARADIDMPSVGPEGDIHVLALSRTVIDWKTMADYSDATIDALVAKAELDRAGAEPPPAPPAPVVATPAAPPVPPPPPAESVWRARVAEHYRRLITHDDPDDEHEDADE